MTTLDKMLRAILLNPNDDVARLAYADLLEEERQNERAEFIRLQICLIDHPSYRTAQMGCLLRRRERELFDNGDARGPVPVLISGRTKLIPDETALEILEIPLGGQDPLGYPVLRFVWSRGFIEEVSLTKSAFMEHAKVLFSLQPVLKVALIDFRPRMGRLTGKSCAFRRLTPDSSNLDDLPPEVWDFMTRDEDLPYGRNYKTYRSSQVLLEEVSNACVRYGCIQAGLNSGWMP